MYFVLAYISAKIAKQCKHYTKLKLIYDFLHVFDFRLAHENQISILFPKMFA